MSKFKKSKLVLKLSLLAALLIIIPLLSSSLRPTFLYFVINLIIIALVAEAGLLSAVFSKPQEDQKHSVSLAPIPEASFEAKVAPARTEKKAKVVEKSASEKIVNVAEKIVSVVKVVKVDKVAEKIVSVVKVVKVDKIKKCLSMPTLFFVGGGETEAKEDAKANEEEEQEVGGLSGQELFHESETFIGKFYEQLKMQRENSFKRSN